MVDKWYVKNGEGKVFGPIDFETLKSWVRDGRVEPLAGLSNDLKSWQIAPVVAELEMNWIVENEPGQFYGPTHRNVVDELLKSGSLSADARFYQDDRGVTSKAIDELRAALTEKDVVLAEKDSAMAKLEQSTGKLEEELSKLREECNRLKVELEMRDAEIARRDAVPARRWEDEVVVPEVVSTEAPPVARNVFGGNRTSLADLERQAQAELAKMGADGARKFFNFGKR